MNKGIKTYLEEYVKRPDPQFAVLIKGEWGCGKTHFINEWIKECEQKKSDKVLKPIYISLYGLKNTKQITVAINRVLYPILYGKGAKVGKSIGKVLSAIVFKHEIDFDSDGDKDIFINMGFDSLSILNSDNEIIKSDKFLIFDDIERCQVELKELFGYINYFVEHCHCHVLIVGDTSQIKYKDLKEEFNAFKEKTIGRDFLLKTDYNAAIDSFVSEVPINEFVKQHVEDIKRTFKLTQSNNLRVLRQCLWDFSRQEMLIDKREDERYEQVVKGILCSFIATYCEYKGRNGTVLSEWRKIVNNSITRNKNDKDQEAILSTVNSIQSKYNVYSSTDSLGIFRSDVVNEIIGYIENGAFITDFINELTKPLTVIANPSWERFKDAVILQNDEFESLYNEVFNDMVEQKINSMYDLGAVVARFSYFEGRNIRLIVQEEKERIKGALPNYLEQFTTMEECHKAYTQFLQGLNFTIRDFESSNVNELIDEIEKEYKRRMKESKNVVTRLLESLDDNNSNDLFDIADQTLPDCSTTYEFVPIFNHVDIEKLFINLKNMKNKGRHDFNSFIRKRYMLNHNLSGWDRKYTDDLEALNILKEKTDKEMTNSTLMDKLSWVYISNSLGTAIKRIEGDFSS